MNDYEFYMAGYAEQMQEILGSPVPPDYQRLSLSATTKIINGIIPEREDVPTWYNINGIIGATELAITNDALGDNEQISLEL